LPRHLVGLDGDACEDHHAQCSGPSGLMQVCAVFDLGLLILVVFLFDLVLMVVVDLGCGFFFFLLILLSGQRPPKRAVRCLRGEGEGAGGPVHRTEN
jgi:hypothetical protein